MSTSTPTSEPAHQTVSELVKRLCACSESNDQDWVVRELVNEVNYRESRFAPLEEEVLRWKTACTYMGRHGCKSEEIKRLCRLIVSSMPIDDVKDYAWQLRIQ